MKTAKEHMKEGGLELDDFISSSAYSAVERVINEARREALIEASNKCGMGLPTFWAVQNAIQLLIRDLK
jgi:hypothetical protein